MTECVSAHGRPRCRMVFVALACAALLTSCGGDYRSVTFETETVSWTLFTQPFNLLPQGGYAAEVQGLVEMDTASGCVYLGNLDFDLSYPVVWPHGTEITEDGAVLLADGRTAPDGEWVYGGGGYLHTEWIATRCPGINNDYGEVTVFNPTLEDIEVGR